MQCELPEDGLVHGGLRRLFGESGGRPDRDTAAIGSEQDRLGEALCIDVVEEAVEAIHQQVDRETAAVVESLRIVVVEQIGEGPLLFGAMAVEIDEQCAVVERGENLVSGRRSV